MPAVIVGEKGRYAIGASLGSGGMASVHRGVEIKTRRPVAIKRLHPHLVANEWVASRFREEAALARRLRHPNVATVLDLVETTDGPALVLELYEGGSLLSLSYASWNRGDPLPQGVASAVVLDVLAALTAAHGLTRDGAPAPVVHRDVSPHNVLFGRDGVAHLADFGVARATDKTDSTDTGSLRGKLSYMAPELFSGKRADPRSDLYGAGVILWELLASERLFEGEVAEVLGKMLASDRSSLALTPRGVPSELEAVTLRALAADPAQRFKDAEVMAEALRAAAPPASREEVAAWVQRNALELPGETEIAVDEPPPSSLLETTRHPRASQKRTTRWIGVTAGTLLLASGAVGLTTLRSRASSAALEPVSNAAPEANAAEAIEETTTTTTATELTTTSASALAATPPPLAPSMKIRVSSSQATAPAPTSPSASRTESFVFTPTAASGAAPKVQTGISNAMLNRGQVAFHKASMSCNVHNMVRVVFHPNGRISTSAISGPLDPCQNAAFLANLGEGEVFNGPAQTYVYGAARGDLRDATSSEVKPESRPF